MNRRKKRSPPGDRCLTCWQSHDTDGMGSRGYHASRGKRQTLGAKGVNDAVAVINAVSIEKFGGRFFAESVPGRGSYDMQVFPCRQADLKPDTLGYLVNGKATTSVAHLAQCTQDDFWRGKRVKYTFDLQNITDKNPGLVMCLAVPRLRENTNGTMNTPAQPSLTHRRVGKLSLTETPRRSGRVGTRRRGPGGHGGGVARGRDRALGDDAAHPLPEG